MSLTPLIHLYLDAYVNKTILILINYTTLSWNRKSALVIFFIWLHSTHSGLTLVTTSHTSHAFPFPSDTPWSFSFPLSFIATTPPTHCTQLSPLFPYSLRKIDVLLHWHLMQMCKSYENTCHISRIQILSILAVPFDFLHQPTAYFLHILVPGIFPSTHACHDVQLSEGQPCYCQHYTEQIPQVSLRPVSGGGLTNNQKCLYPCICSAFLFTDVPPSPPFRQTPFLI